MRPIISEELLEYLTTAENISFFADEDEEDAPEKESIIYLIDSEVEEWACSSLLRE